MGEDVERRVVHGPADERYAAPVDPPVWHGPSIPMPDTARAEVEDLAALRRRSVEAAMQGMRKLQDELKPVREEMARSLAANWPRRPAEWTIRNEPLDRDR